MKSEHSYANGSAVKLDDRHAVVNRGKVFKRSTKTWDELLAEAKSKVSPVTSCPISNINNRYQK
jgi:hypothetical protein